MTAFIDAWKVRARQLKTEVYALYLAYKDSRTPWYARIFTALVVAYAFSPIDLIPDPIPVLGYLDDLVLIPIGIYLALKLIPVEVMADSRLRAKQLMAQDKPVNRVAAVVIVLIWIGLAVLVGAVVYRWVTSR
ncbi:MAG: hypothetical protein A2Z71_09465 [Chloroflexi bacterium RBG_13_50_21]|nr:MAG: hypothetical protein A2Z71_09465 [Chloroflexi bacterium RBG_13_50_21]OGO64564.1 MAG: hypothetical protein A2030_04920 [Chloroflexi bacterium RBG_19FT_COMBO_50_10]